MKTMQFTAKQPNVSIYPLDKGIDIIICLNEREITIEGIGENTGNQIETMYEYDGNVFRTFRLSADDIAQAPGSYIDYGGDTEPTKEMTAYANEMIDAYTEQLIMEGVIV